MYMRITDEALLTETSSIFAQKILNFSCFQFCEYVHLCSFLLMVIPIKYYCSKSETINGNN